MEDKEVIQKYINNFRRHLSPHLKSGIGVKSTIHPSTESGPVSEFSLGNTIGNDDEYKPLTSNVNASLDTIDQHAFGGNLFAFKFSGTSTLLEPGELICSQKSWPILIMGTIGGLSYGLKTNIQRTGTKDQGVCRPLP